MKEEKLEGNPVHQTTEELQPSLYRALYNQTSQIAITEMTPQQKFETLLSVILGVQKIRGWFRPRDLPFNKQAVEAVKLARQLDCLTFDPSDDIQKWELKSKKPDYVTKTGQRYFTDFVFDLGLLLRNRITGFPVKVGDYDDWKWDIATQIILFILGENTESQAPKRIDWKSECMKCRALLSFVHSVNSLDKFCRKNQTHYANLRKFIEEVANNSVKPDQFTVYSFRISKIHEEYINRWKEVQLRSGASSMVYHSISLIREKLIDQYGLTSVIHDYAGRLFALLPSSAFKETSHREYIDTLLLKAYDKRGPLKEQFEQSADELLSKENTSDEMKLNAFPYIDISYISEPIDHSNFNDWFMEEDGEKKINDEKKYPTRGETCCFCGRYEGVTIPHRWDNKTGQNKCCLICKLIAGMGSASIHGFQHDISFLMAESKPNTMRTPKAINKRSRSQDMSEDGEVTFLSTDGDSVGKKILQIKGIHNHRRISSAINFDLHNRVRNAVSNGWEEMTSKNFLSLDMLWLGGDDMMVRCAPSASKFFKNAFKPGENDLFTYTTVTKNCTPAHKDMIDIADKLKKKMGSKKEKKKSLINSIKSDTFENILDILQAIRLPAELGFNLDPTKMNLIKKKSYSVTKLPAGEILTELIEIFNLDCSSFCIRKLDDLGILEVIFPEIKAMKGCKQNDYHHLDVWNHSLAVLENCDYILNNLKYLFSPVGSEVWENLNSGNRLPLLKVAALLHDIGKPKTIKIREGTTDQVVFYEHDKKGMEIVAAIACRLKMSEHDTTYLKTLVENHMKILHLSKPEVNEKTIQKRFKKLQNDIIPLIILEMADINCTRGPKSRETDRKRHNEWSKRMINEYYIKEPETEPLVNGKDLLALGMNPGPEIGKILKSIKEAQCSDQIKDKKEAVALAKKLINNQ